MDGRTPERDLVDQLIDRGLELAPATDWTLMLPEEVTLLIPHDSDQLQRGAGYFRTHVYRNREVVGLPMARPLAVLSDPAGLSASLYVNLLTGRLGTSFDQVGLIGLAKGSGRASGGRLGHRTR